MQGQRSAVGSLPEVLGFDHGSSSSDAGLDQQICWNSMRNFSQNRLPDYMTSSSDTSIGYLNVSNPQGLNLSGWDFGESSSRVGQSEVTHNDQKTEHGWSSPINACAATASDGQHFESSDILSLNNVNVNVNASVDLHGNDNANGTVNAQNVGSNSIPRDLNMNSEFSAQDDGDCQVLECPNTYKSGGSANGWMPSAGSSSDPFGLSSGRGGFLVDESDDRPGCSLDGRRQSCKRKTIEGNPGQSSGSGSSNYIQHSESSLWHAVPARHNASGSTSISSQAENSIRVNFPEHVNPRLGLSVGRVASENSPGLTASTTTESSHRNFRLRINASHQQDLPNNVFPAETNIGSANTSPSVQHSLRLLPHNNSLDFRPVSATDNATPQVPSVVVHLSSLRQNPRSRWNGASSSRTGSSSTFAISGERDAALHEVSTSASVPRNVSEYPMFLPSSETGNSLQNPPNWSLGGGNVSVAGGVASTSRGGSGTSGSNSSAPFWNPHRNPSQYPRRLSEYVRRSLLSSTDPEFGGQIMSYPSGPSSSQEMVLPSGPGNHSRHSNSRSAMLFDRHLDGTLGIPYSLRTLAAASEGRSRLVSEIRNVLDLMRRGEGLQFEDVMILDQSVFFGMADIHDRHRDMRLDVDNMSYEELLALEERIGNVSTGLSEETVLKQLKQRKYVCCNTDEVEAEPCCICQEEYNDGEDLGALECGHDFHAECIKQWLMHKNLCPICKTTGLAK